MEWTAEALTGVGPIVVVLVVCVGAAVAIDAAMWWTRRGRRRWK